MSKSTVEIVKKISFENEGQTLSEVHAIAKAAGVPVEEAEWNCMNGFHFIFEWTEAVDY